MVIWKDNFNRWNLQKEIIPSLHLHFLKILLHVSPGMRLYLDFQGLHPTELDLGDFPLFNEFVHMQSYLLEFVDQYRCGYPLILFICSGYSGWLAL